MMQSSDGQCSWTVAAVAGVRSMWTTRMADVAEKEFALQHDEVALGGEGTTEHSVGHRLLMTAACTSLLRCSGSCPSLA